MFKNILKYDLKLLYRFLLPLYLVVFLLAIVARGCHILNNSFISATLEPVISGMGIGCAVGALTNNVMRCWIYFRNNLYGDEGYLTNTLPLTKRTLYFSKLFAALITILTSSLLFIATFVIIYGTPENCAGFWDFINSSAQSFQISSATLIIAVIILLLIEFFCWIAIGFFGIILGQRMQSVKTLCAVAFGVATFFTLQVLFVVIAFGISLLCPEMRGIFTGSSEAMPSTIKSFILAGIFFYFFATAALSLISIKILDRGIDLE